MPDSMELQQMEAIWNACCANYTGSQDVIAISFDEIRRRYTGTARHYHNLQHIGQMLQLATQHRDQLQDWDNVVFAIFYHDVVYNVFRKDNEARSADMADKRLATLCVTADRIQVVRELIKATHKHEVPANASYASDLNWFLDFDMSILGTPWEQYEVYARQVRKEYRLYPDLMYNPGRRSFLQHTLQAAHIFHTPYFSQQYTDTARANMQRELQWYQ